VLIGPLVISPGKAFTEPLFVLLTIALFSLALGLRRARPRRPVAMAMIAMALLWILSTPVASNAIARSLIVNEPRTTAVPEVIVIAAGGASFGALNMTSENRVIAGVAWWHRNPRALLVIAGVDTVLSGRSPTTAILMRAEAIRFGVPAGSIALDLRSNDTREHAIELAKRPGITPLTRVGVVTSDWHMRRALGAFRRHFRTVIPYPAENDYSEPIILGSFLPSSSGLWETTIMLHEWIGIAWYALRG
jgi:uncharacterized SAM-binding protein YcdF (DUF218 family)